MREVVWGDAEEDEIFEFCDVFDDADEAFKLSRKLKGFLDVVVKGFLDVVVELPSFLLPVPLLLLMSLPRVEVNAIFWSEPLFEMLFKLGLI